MSIQVEQIGKYTSAARSYVFDFTGMLEVAAGDTISAPVVASNTVGLTIGSPTVLTAETHGVAAGKGVRVSISGGTAGTTYTLTCTVTLSGGGTLPVKGQLVVE